MIWSRIERYAKDGCPTLCNKVRYDVRLSQLSENSMTISESYTGIYAKYAVPKIKVEEEYTLMGINAIISAAGGSLGLFLGFSCYGAIWNIFEMVEYFFDSIFSSKKKKAKSGNGRMTK